MSETDTDRVAEAVHLASAYVDTGNYERARDVLRRALAENPTDPVLQAHLARAEYMLGNYDTASHSAYGALSAAPQYEFAMRLYALSLEGLGRPYDALWMAWRTVLTHPNEPAAQRLYAKLLQNSRQLTSALLVVDEALRLDPMSVDALVLRGSILHDLRRIPESTATYLEALASDPGNATALHNIAVNRLLAGKFSLALRGFLRAARSDPTLGDLARRNIADLVTKVLKSLTVVAVLLGLFVVFVGVAHDQGEPTSRLRMLAGLFTAVLIAILGWLLRAIPRGVISYIFRNRGFVAARLIHAASAACAGAGVTVFGGSAWAVAVGGMLIVIGLILARAGVTLGW
ncbi:tetratricopeptide repeat protein [Mycobacterium persicum]|uniref:tetratricopeptide repeat protein n=1 Tax=Mycobacterium persicum TaxID=1487726 RepID=UPI0015935B4F|nr:tetratricopeptide repeat protein [Mycobacterium persicum]